MLNGVVKNCTCCTTACQERYIRQIALGHHQEISGAVQIDFRQATGVRISDQTVHNWLHKENLAPKPK